MDKDIKYIVINFGNSDYTNFFIKSAEKYCKTNNIILLYWKNAGKSDRYESFKKKTLTDENYIRKEIVNKFIGEYILFEDYDSVLTSKDISPIVDLAKRLTEKIDLLTEKEFKAIESDMDLGEWLVISFIDNEFDFKIY